MLGAAFALVAATLLPAASVFADALNPLTERSLLLSSSAPGFQNTDGSGNSETALNANGDEFAPPGSGPNGMKSGETFSFNVSTDSSITGKAIKAFTLQYCATAAGLCKAPGNNAGDFLTTNRKTNAAALASGDNTSDLDVVGAFTEGTAGGQFQVIVDGVPQTGWSMTQKNVEDPAYIGGGLTGTKNFIVLTNATGATPTTGKNVKIVFHASTNAYITNPGAGAFFVRMNTYNDDNTSGTALLPNTSANILDGGVTVANVMTDSIHITTKVLETMSFSVGTVNPDNVNMGSHGSCDPINVVNGNRLQLGNPNAEYSLETGKAYDVNSYWRLSSNSSGGATVYYSGNTLANTVGDEIKSIGTTAGTPNGGLDYSHPGTEQFGLALVNPATDTLGTGTFDTAWTLSHTTPLVVESDYSQGDGTINSVDPNDPSTNAKFAFDKASLTVPRLIAQENSTVVDCSTAKVRYVANIAANTPAGVYTTKINYLAAPQY